MRETQELLIRKKLEQLCYAMKLISGRDTEKTVLQVLTVFVREHGPIGGSMVSERTGLNRITCIHHIKRLESAGLVRKKDRHYELSDLEEFFGYYRKLMHQRMSMMEELISEIENFRN